MQGAPTVGDRYGLPLSSSSTTAVERYVEGVDRTLAGNAGQEACFEQALAADEGFALAHIALARTLQYRGLAAEARQRAQQACALTAGVTRRERQHIEAIAAAVEGDGPRALALIREHLAEFPRDAFLLLQANGPFGLIGFGGGQERHHDMFDLLTSVAPAYGDDWWFLSAYAFAHNELDRHDEARRLAERSLALYPRSGHTSHTMAHVFYETGDPSGGAAFLSDWIAGYERAAQLYGHLTWHLALFELASGRYQQVMELYDQVLRPSMSQGAALITVADAASLLWRCDLYGGGQGPLPWDEVRDFAARAFPRPGITFADLHCALAYAAAGDGAALGLLIDGLRRRHAEGKLPAGEVVPALAEGIAAFAAGDYETVVRLLEPVAEQIIRVGGSNAQREVFEDTLLEAYLRTERCEQAEALLRRRLDRRPSARDSRWLSRAQTAGGQVEPAAAGPQTARSRRQGADAAE